MPTPPTDPTARLRLRSWLQAERRGDDSGAERELGAVMAALPKPLLPPGFAERVLLRVAAERAAWPLERAALWLLLVCATALSVLPLWLPGIWDRLAPASWVSLGAELLVEGAKVLALVAPLWEALLRIGRWAALAASAPPAILFLAFCGLLAVTAGRLLASLLDERSSAHAQIG